MVFEKNIIEWSRCVDYTYGKANLQKDKQGRPSSE
jgi:hypothetical protein